MLQWELCTIGNSNLITREAEMTNLEQTRRQELRNPPFLSNSLFRSELVEEGESYSLKRHPEKHSGCWTLSKSTRWRPHHNKEAPTENAPMGTFHSKQ